jgi:hypothetical protein
LGVELGSHPKVTKAAYAGNTTRKKTKKKRRKEIVGGDESLKGFSTSQGHNKPETYNQVYWTRNSNTFIKKKQPTSEIVIKSLKSQRIHPDDPLRSIQ